LERFFDSKNQRLVYVNEAATDAFWDNHWANQPDPVTAKANETLLSRLKGALRQDVVLDTSHRYLPTGGRVLEGGCGQGQHVVSLSHAGYSAVGLDFAPETVKLLHEQYPDLDFKQGDVRDLPFENESFDGYWSLGVIEHFWDGYEPIAREMHRVLRPGGYLFLTFPYLSPLRKWKVQRDYFPALREDSEPEGFYQFALDGEVIAEDFKQRGFTLVEKRGLSGLKGLKDEVAALKPMLQRLYSTRSLPGRGLKRLISPALAQFAGHGVLLVLKRNS